MKKKFMLILALLFLSIACSHDGSDPVDEAKSSNDSDIIQSDVDDVEVGDHDFQGEKEPEIEHMAKVTRRAKFVTNMGEFTIALYGEAMPITVENFVRYIEEGFYDGTVFHRIIKGFVAQGGGYLPGIDEDFPYPAMERKNTNDPIKLEISEDVTHIRYALSMARTDEPDSATSQFFIAFDNAGNLDGDYAAFGLVETGRETVDKMENVKTIVNGSMEDVPEEAVIIEKAVMLD